MIEGLAACFAGLTDPRETSRCDHQLVDMPARPLAHRAQQPVDTGAPRAAGARHTPTHPPLTKR